MKTLLSLLAGGLVLAAGVVSTQGPPPQGQGEDLAPRVAALEQEVATLQQENAALRALLDETVAYLQAQARASEEMLTVLDRSEEQGFTKGINFQSRETLLGGFRSFWKETADGVPKPAVPKGVGDGDGVPERGRRPAVRGGR